MKPASIYTTALVSLLLAITGCADGRGDLTDAGFNRPDGTVVGMDGGGTDAGPPDSGARDAGPPDTGVRMCIGFCRSNNDCQNSCPLGTATPYCCDIPSGMCSLSTTSMCTAPMPTTDAGMTPYM